MNNNVIQEDLEQIYHNDVDWKRFSGKTILITGANGALPAYLVEMLLYLNKYGINATIIALVRNIDKAKKRFEDYNDYLQLKYLQQDVSEEIVVDENIDFIIHAASQASPKYYRSDPVGTLCANLLGTINVMKLAQKHCVESVLYFSSGEVYGALEDKYIPTKEQYFGYLDPTDVRSCYAESKRMGENICVSWFQQYGIPTKIVRPFHTYGPKMQMDDGRVYADFIADILANRDIIIKSDGSAMRAFCYLSDATIGFFKVLLNGQNGEAYNIGNPDQEYSVLELAQILTNIYPERGLKINMQLNSQDANYVKSPVRRSCPDINKMHKLNWYPVVTVAEGFKRVLNNYNP
ncbi:MAG TPA: UDP-glucuronate decarboxylase [Sphingobacteriaceae bacterium]|nr:UDP-glucuronate decarboxylase [Sphingobacteriaceae bacterium]